MLACLILQQLIKETRESVEDQTTPHRRSTSRRRNVKTTAFQTFLARIKTTYSEVNKIKKKEKLSIAVVRGCMELDDDRFERIVDVTDLKKCLTAPSWRQTLDGFVSAVRMLSDEKLKTFLADFSVTACNSFKQRYKVSPSPSLLSLSLSLSLRLSLRSLK